MVLAFKKGTGIMPWLIRLITRSDYSHVEAIIKDRWISSKEGEGIHINQLRPLGSDWTYIELDVPKEKDNEILQWVWTQRNSGYDWCGVLCSQLFGINKEHKEKWFCSELVACIIKRYDISLGDCCDYSPGDLFRIFKDNK